MVFKISDSLRSLCEQVQGEVEEAYDEKDPGKLKVFLGETRKGLLESPLLGLEFPVYLSMSLLSEVKFLSSDRWEKWIEAGEADWKEVKPLVEVTKEARAVIKAFEKEDDVLVKAVLANYIVENLTKFSGFREMDFDSE